MRNPVFAYANNKRQSQSLHPNSLISAFIGLCLETDSLWLLNWKFQASGLFTVAVGTGLDLYWSNSDDIFYYDVAHITKLGAVARSVTRLLRM